MKKRLDWIGWGCVVGTVGVITAIVLPPYLRSRHVPSGGACTNNLRLIDSGKEQEALASKWDNSVDCDIRSNKVLVNMYIKGNTTPLCPSGGTYSYNLVGQNPTCSKYKADDPSTRYHHLPEPQ